MSTTVRVAPQLDTPVRAVDRGQQVWLAALAIVALGVPFVFNASAIMADAQFGDPYLFLKKHLVRALIAALVCWGVSRVDYRQLHRFSKGILLVSVLLLSLVLILPESGFAPVINGARRWLVIPGFGQFQPSEAARIGMVVYLAAALSRKDRSIRDFGQGLLPTALVCTVLAALVVLGRDLGTTLTLGMLFLVMLFSGGARMVHLAGFAGIGAAATWILIRLEPYRIQRLTAFMEPEIHKDSAVGYHIWQSLIGLASGGWTGVGSGRSRQKLHFLPEPHTDFLFSIVGEEMGFIGAVVLLTCYGVLGYLGLRAAREARDDFGRYLAIGITSMIVLNAFLHVAVVTALVPTTGIPMPLFSYGGTSLVVTMAAIGILVNVASQSQPGGRRWGRVR